MTNNTTSPTAQSVLTAGVDWITVTCSDRKRRTDLMHLGYAFIHDAQAFGEKTSPFRGHGYLGTSSTHCAIAERREDAYLRLSGSLAGAHWRAATECATNVSRVDLQATLLMDEPWIGWSAKLYGTLSLWAEEHSKPTNVTRMYNRNGSDTVYVGRRTSNRYGRIYDKGIESGAYPPGVALRYEWEYKAPLAAKILESLSAAPDTDRASLSVVGAELRRRNTLPPGFDLVHGELPLLRRPLPDPQRTRAYFLRIARAGVKRELERSTPEEVCKILGIPLDRITGG